MWSARTLTITRMHAFTFSVWKSDVFHITHTHCIKKQALQVKHEASIGVQWGRWQLCSCPEMTPGLEIGTRHLPNAGDFVWWWIYSTYQPQWRVNKSSIYKQ